MESKATDIEYLELISKYLAGQLDDGDFSRLNGWLEESEQNREMLFGLEAAIGAYAAEERTDSRSVEKALRTVMAKNRAHDAAKKRRHRFRRTMSILTGSVAAVAVVLFFLVFNRATPNMIRFAVAADDPVSEILLPDGTKIWLNSGSAIAYPETFSETNRTLQLDGEAYFEVVKNPAAPFTVTSKSFDVQVLGTAFNMCSYSHEVKSEATLIEGEIRVTGNNSEGQIILCPGQRCEIDRQTGRMIVREVKNAVFDAIWRNDLISFEGSTIYDIAEALEQLYDVRIVFTESSKITNRYSGVIKRMESVDEVLSSLKNSIPITYTISGETIYIARANTCHK